MSDVYYTYDQLSEKAKGVAIDQVHEKEQGSRDDTFDYEYVQEEFKRIADDHGLSFEYINWSSEPTTLTDISKFCIDDFTKVFGEQKELFDFINEELANGSLEEELDLFSPEKSAILPGSYQDEPEVALKTFKKYHEAGVDIPFFKENWLRYSLLSTDELVDEYWGEIESDMETLVSYLCTTKLEPRLTEVVESFADKAHKFLDDTLDYYESNRWVKDSLEGCGWEYENYVFTKEGDAVQRDDLPEEAQNHLPKVG